MCGDFIEVAFAANPKSSGTRSHLKECKELTVGRLQFFEVVEVLSGQGPDAFWDQERNSVFFVVPLTSVVACASQIASSLSSRLCQ